MNDKDQVLSLQNVETESEIEPRVFPITITTTLTTATSFWSTVSNNC